MLMIKKHCSSFLIWRTGIGLLDYNNNKNNKKGWNTWKVLWVTGNDKTAELQKIMSMEEEQRKLKAN